MILQDASEELKSVEDKLHITIRRRDVESFGPYRDYNQRGKPDGRRRVRTPSSFPFAMLQPGDHFAVRMGEKRNPEAYQKLRKEIKAAANRYGIHVIIKYYYEIDKWVVVTTHDGEIK